MATQVCRLQLKGISLGASAALSCAHSSLTSLELGPGSSYSIDVVPLLLWHHRTLRSLSLSDVWIDDRNLVLDAMPALAKLCLKGSSIAFLDELSHTRVPLLSTIALEFSESRLAPESLWTFARMRLEAPVSTLVLSGTGRRFSDFVPAILQWRQLVHLTLEGYPPRLGGHVR
ncbi:hypothetical protein AURDEDRAFT_178562 [Auricularia subglabra TFB-10046 SS5]|uniref:F-box domain-containing protein n=1 Tax=Auricularia subglabra (strain TFB-10046 / SS5) TaxID=717982 RepID=J0WJA7_AURST|nr:hypothetical protein AURDEDRAFT_178562 [Auricularia subglabra TFB-10046 SS5]